MTLSEIKKDCQKKMKQAMNDLHTEAEDIINEFAKFGLKVELEDFREKTYPGWDTHYVATCIGELKC